MLDAIAMQMLLGYNLRLVLPSIHHPISVHSNNKGIIDEVLRLKLFNRDKLKLFNITRIYFKVIFISDLTSSSNNEIRECYYNIMEQECKRSYK